MCLVTADAIHLVQVADLAVDADLQVAVRAEPLEQIPVVPLAAAHHGRQQRDLSARRQLVDGPRDLLQRLVANGRAAVRAVGRADPGVEQAQEVVDLRRRGHRGARAGARHLLLDGDCGRQAQDEVAVRARDLLQELAGVRRQALDVATLAFGVERVKRERRLAAAADAGDDDQGVPGQFQVDAFQVVRPRVAHADVAVLFRPRSTRAGQCGGHAVCRVNDHLPGLAHSRGPACGRAPGTGSGSRYTRTWRAGSSPGTSYSRP